MSVIATACLSRSHCASAAGPRSSSTVRDVSVGAATRPFGSNSSGSRTDVVAVPFGRLTVVSAKRSNKPPADGYPGLIYDWEYRRTCGWRRDECTLRKMFLAWK